MELREVVEEVAAWSVQDRLRLIGELCSAIESDPWQLLTEEQIADLQRREESHRDNPSDGAMWEEVEVRLRRERN